ncbi:uncharacterized protein LOC114531745 [Dendronephthya gigantea]|uniref:uncharacterized protein LOC114531745 n=1 Tax=Dendronephthya gigantea TaxID=151771 RepID=UPI00106D1DFE|nr:uncharacterized protein LOC114531745 [Dendronephthya gigantea]
MAVKDEVLIFIRNTASALYPECKVIVAPTLVGVYLNKSKDVLMRTALSHHWKFQNRGVLALVYHPVLNRLKLMVFDEKSGRVHWQETFGDYTNYECIHEVFHILNSSKNFCQKIGLFYADDKVAKMVNGTLEVFSAQRRREQARKDRCGKLVTRSKSFNNTERVNVEVKLTRSHSNSMGDIKIHRTALNLFEAEARKYALKQTSRRPSLRKMFSGLRSSFRVRIRRRDSNEENEDSKRSRLSTGSGIEEKSQLNQNQMEPKVVPDEMCPDNTEHLDVLVNEMDTLSANWKLTDVELKELYRLSFFKERNVQSTDLCATEL